MANIFTDTFEANNFSLWTSHYATAAIAHDVAGMEAGYCLDLTDSGNHQQVVKTLGAPVGEIWLAFDFMPANLAYAYGNILTFKLGSTYIAQLYANGSGDLPIVVNLAAWGGSGAFTLVENNTLDLNHDTKYRIQVHFKPDAVNGIFQVKVNGTLAIDYVGAMAPGHPTAQTTLDTIVFGAQSSDSMYMYVDNVLMDDAAWPDVEAPPEYDIPASTGGWVLGGTGFEIVLPTLTLIPTTPVDSQTGFLLGGDGNPASMIPQVDRIIAEEAAFLFCGPGVSGHAATSKPHLDALVPEGGFVMGGAGVWGQVGQGGLPSAVLVPTGGYVLGGGSGFSLDPGVTPSETVLVGTGGWKLGGNRPDPVEVTYPGLVDRTIDDPAGFEMGGEGVWGQSLPPSTLIVSNGAIFFMSGAGRATVKLPPIAVITGDALGGFVLGGPDAAEVYEAWGLFGQAFEPAVWSNFAFNSFCVKGGQAYGANENGIYLLGGDTDAGEAIRSGARVGPVNLGSDHDKRLRSIHYGGKAGPNMKIRVTADDTPGSPGPSGVFVSTRDDNQLVVSRDIQGEEFTFDFMDFEELSGVEITPLRLARR